MLLIELIKKNFLVLVRSRASALALIVIPLLAITIAALAFEHSKPFALELGIYSPEDQKDESKLLIKSFIKKLSERFKINLFKFEKDCIKAAERGETHACLAFAKDFELGKAEQNEILFYLDHSRLNIVWTVMSMLGQTLGGRTIELAQNLTSKLVKAVDVAENETKTNAKIIINLVSQNEDTEKKSNEISNKIGSLNLEFQPIAFEEIFSASNKAKGWIISAADVALDSIQTASAALGAVAGASPSEAREDLAKKMKKLDEARDRINELKNLASTDFKKLEDLIAQVSTQLEQAKQIFSNAENVKRFSLSELSEIKNKLDLSLISLAAFQKSLNEIQSYIKEIEVRDPKLITQPIATTIRPLAASPSYLKYAFPILIVLFIAYASTIFGTVLAILEKQNPAKLRIATFKIGKSFHYLAALLTTVLISFFQFLLITTIASIIFNRFAQLPTILLIGFQSILIFSSLGVAIGYGFKVEHSALIAAIASVTTAFILTDIVLPIEVMPKEFVFISSINPLLLAIKSISQIIVFGFSKVVLEKILILTGFTLGFLVLSFVAFLISEKKQ